MTRSSLDHRGTDRATGRRRPARALAWVATLAAGAALLAAGSATASDSTAEVTVSSGDPTLATASFQAQATTLDGTDQTPTAPAAGITGSSAAAFTNSSAHLTPTVVTVLDAPGPHRGHYTFSPRLGIEVPATAAPSYTGLSSTPYTAILTVTIE